jgi:hypothetical protein
MRCGLEVGEAIAGAGFFKRTAGISKKIPGVIGASKRRMLFDPVSFGIQQQGEI